MEPDDALWEPAGRRRTHVSYPAHSSSVERRRGDIDQSRQQQPLLADTRPLAASALAMDSMTVSAIMVATLGPA